MIACYDSSNFTSEPACNLFDRDATGQVIDARTGFVNVGLVEFAGVQTVLSYDIELGNFGNIILDLNHLYTEKHIETPGSGNSRQLSGQIGYSENRVNLGGTWTKNQWTVFGQLRWLDGAVFDNPDDEFTRDVSGVDDWFVADMSVVYAFNDEFDLQLNIDNVLDEDPPYGAMADFAGITTYYPGVRGRYLTLTARMQFQKEV